VVLIKLIFLIVFVFMLMGLVILLKKFIKWCDRIILKEKMDDIKTESELVDDVGEFKKENKKKITKYKSDAVNEFINLE